MIYRNYKAEGVVLKRINFGEKDKIVTIFTRNSGKIAVLARGIRNIQSRKAPHLELFTRISFYAAVGKSLDIITEAYTLESFPRLRKNLEKVAYAYSIAEILDRLCAEGQEHPNIFDLLLVTLRKIDKEEADFRKTVDEFTQKTLWDLGFLIHGRQLATPELQAFLEEVMEKNLKSDSLLEKICREVST